MPRNNKSLLGKILSSIFSNNETVNKHSKDYSWKKSKNNPYKKRTKEKSNWKRYALLVFLIMAVLTTFGVGLFHPFFQIKNINIRGLDRIDKNEFRSSVRGIYSYKKFFVLPANNYFLLNQKEIKTILNNKYPLKSVKIKKDFPDTLNLEVREKISTIIYDNGKKYSYIGLQGNVVEVLRKVGKDEWNIKKKMVTTTTKEGEETKEEKIIYKNHTPQVDSIINEMGEYPIIYDKRDNKKTKVNKKMLDKNVVSGVVEWYELIKNNTDLNFKYSTIGTTTRDFVIYTNKRWDIKADPEKNIMNQFKKLRYILNKKNDINPNANYVNLIYRDRVYWK